MVHNRWAIQAEQQLPMLPNAVGVLQK